MTAIRPAELLRQLDIAELERLYDQATDDREALLVLLRAARKRRATDPTPSPAAAAGKAVQS